MGKILNRPPPDWQHQKLILAKEIVRQLAMLNDKLDVLLVKELCEEGKKRVAKK